MDKETKREVDLVIGSLTTMGFEGSLFLEKMGAKGSPAMAAMNVPPMKAAIIMSIALRDPELFGMIRLATKLSLNEELHDAFRNLESKMTAETSERYMEAIISMSSLASERQKESAEHTKALIDLINEMNDGL